MRVKNLTGLPFGTKPTSRSGRAAEMVVVVRARFDLVPGAPLALLAPQFEGDLMTQGSLSGELYADDDEERAGECVYPGDFADFKPKAEVMLRGACHPPRGAPTTECLVTAEVGRWQKKLRVFGTRAWSDSKESAVMSAPLPFTTMPIDWAHAFGGPGAADNPLGKGLVGAALPNIETLGTPIRFRADRPAPAGFGPINPSWAARSSKLGTDYGPAWRATRAPWYADDFDWRYFQAAPSDQQLDGYLQGDESLRFTNLHPRAAVLESSLPRLRIRAFVRCTGGTVSEIPMNLDTLFVDLHADSAALTWRGLAPVGQDDLSDVETVLLARETLGEPLPASHYHRELEAFEDDPFGGTMKQGLVAQRDEGFARLDASMAALAKIGTGGEAALGKEIAAVSGGPPAHGARVADALAARRDKQPGAPDVTAGLAAAFAAPASLRSPPALKLPEVGKPIGLPIAAARDLAASVTRAKKAQADVVAARSAAGAPPPPDFALEPFEALASELDIRDRPTIEPGPSLDLRGQDYCGRDLRGRDLSYANLESALLTGADLRGASLRGCNLSHAVLHQAQLEGADLGGAQLAFCTLTEARAAKVGLRGARLEYTQLAGADLTGADLAEAQITFTVLGKAVLTGATFGEATISDSMFDACSAERTDFAGARIVSAMFLECNLGGASFQRAVLTKTSFLRSSAMGASFRRASGEGAVFFSAKLDRADFTLGSFRRGLFTQAEAIGGIFAGADLKDAVFYRATLDRADFSGSNLFNADLRKTSIHRARFVDANLFQAALLGAAGRDTDFSGANLVRCSSGPE